MCVSAVTYALSAAASNVRSEAAGDAVPWSRPSDNANEAAPSAEVTVIPNRSTKSTQSLFFALRLRHRVFLPGDTDRAAAV